MTKKINKVTIYYDDGTYEEIKTGVSDTQNQQNKTTTPWPDLRPDYYKIKEYDVIKETCPEYWKSPFVVTCENASAPVTYKITSTGNAGLDYKYTITSTGNGNVDLSK
jgi:hypothetical protein